MGYKSISAALAAMALSVSAAFAGIWYVTPSGAGAKDGTSWASAFDTLQDAIDASASGDTVCLAAGVYTNSQPNAAEPSLCLVTGRARLTIRGGYAGTGSPGERGAGESIFRNPEGRLARLMRGNDIALDLDGLAFEGGRIQNGSGGGLCFKNVTLSMTNCVIRDCSIQAVSSGHGGGLFLDNGSLFLADSTFSGNRADDSTTGRFALYGGAISIRGGKTTEVVRCTFDGNWNYGNYRVAQGGAIRVEGGVANFRDCTFATNVVSTPKGYNDGRAWGSAICAASVSRLYVADSVFLDNLSHGMTGAGAIFFNKDDRIGGAWNGTGVVERCSIVATNCAAIPKPFSPDVNACDFYGGVGVGAGTLLLTNVLVATDAQGAAVEAKYGRIELSKCTLAGGRGKAARSTGGDCRLTRCIVDDFEGGLFDLVAGSFDANFSCLPSLAGVQGGGNTAAGALLSADGFYHPLSRAGYYTGGFFGGGSWQTAPSTSPTIDMAPASDPHGAEPQPNGHRANVGYDANTPVASRSDLGEPPVPASFTVYAYPPTNVSDTAASARGEVTAPASSVTIVWGTADGGTGSPSDWEHSRGLGAKEAWDLFATVIQNAGPTTYYRLYATNATASAWSEPVVSYKAVRPPVLAEPGVSHVTRHEALVRWNLVDDGYGAVEVSVLYWPTGGNVTSTATFGPCPEGPSRLLLRGLEAGIPYNCLVEARNLCETTRTAPCAFSTYPTTPQARYVTPEGAGLRDGSDWANAFSNFQEAVDFCRYAGDAVYMKAGVYVQPQPDVNATYHYFVTNHPGLSVLGGYEGAGAPGARGGERTVLRRDLSRECQIVYAENSTLRLDGVDFDRGGYKTDSARGLGMHLENCALAATNCWFTNNRVDFNDPRDYYGCAVYAYQGSLAFGDCVFTNNGAGINTDNSRVYGGAVYARFASSASFARCLFARNFSASPYHSTHGGALYFTSCGPTLVDSCRFLTNAVVKHTAHTSTFAYGGAIFAENLKTLDLRDSHFAGNYAVGSVAIGGVLYLKDDYPNDGTMTTTVSRCTFVQSGHLVTNASLGSIALLSGRLEMDNVLQGATTRGTGLDILGGSARFVNVTVADCASGYGIAVAPTAACEIRNGIVWGNELGGVHGEVSASYTCSQEGLAGAGNFVADPLFVDDGRFHLKSHGGYLADGYFEGSLWLKARENSPCIDAGDPESDWTAETRHHGHRINLGAYGGTAAATRTYINDATLLLLR